MRLQVHTDIYSAEEFTELENHRHLQSLNSIKTNTSKVHSNQPAICLIPTTPREKPSQPLHLDSQAGAKSF